jgi:hypothetical protein
MEAFTKKANSRLDLARRKIRDLPEMIKNLDDRL